MHAGLNLVEIADKTIPKAGFFVNLDFTNIKNISIKNYKIESETDLLKFCINECNFKFMCGQTYGWPDKNQLVGRISISSNKRDLIQAFVNLNNKIKELYYEGS